MDRTRRESRGLPAPLDEALTSRMPAGPLPPGPRANAWDRVGAVADEPHRGVSELVDALWHPGEYHRDADGSATRIRRRPVPSAGACYPVQTHLIDPTGVRWTVDQEGVFHRRVLASDRADGWPSPASDDGTARLVFTVLPGRSFGRYRHRAWPLWIADAAYAVAAVRFLLGERAGPVQVGPSKRLREMLGVPRAADADAWVRRGLAPEIPLAAVGIPHVPTPHAAAVQALGTRRSPAISEFADRIGGSPTTEVERVARASGQGWVRGATEVRSWSVPSRAPSTIVGATLWRAHLAAARLCYEAALTGDRRTRPVSGFSSTADRWILHAIAVLDSRGGAR